MNFAVVRQMRADEAAAVRALLVHCWHATYDGWYGATKVTDITNRWHRADLLRRQAEEPAQRCLVAEADGELLGHALARKSAEDRVELARLYVEPERQGKGIGAALLQAALADWPGVAVAELEVEARNEQAIGFYRKFGFVPVGEQMSEGERVLLMERGL
jgi:ribosomal protein S18 acetylase RimI-like enzyme